MAKEIIEKGSAEKRSAVGGFVAKEFAVPIPATIMYT